MFTGRRKFIQLMGSTVVGSAVASTGGSATAADVERDEAHWWTDFGDASPGSPPLNWERAFGGDLVPTVEETAGSHHLRLRKSGDGKDGVVWTVPGDDRRNVELLVEWRSASSSELTNRLMCAVRVDREAGTVYLGGHGQTRSGRLAAYTPSFSEVATSEAEGFSSGTRIRQRLRVEGDQLRVKVWEAGTREPPWDLTVTDESVVGGGEVGLFTWGSSHAATDILVSRVATAVAGGEASVHDPDAEWNRVDRPITFPLGADCEVSYVDGWDELRDGGERVHRATDLYADYGSPVYAMASGTVRGWLPGVTHTITPGAGGGYQIHVDTDDGDHRHVYAHLGPDETGSADAAFAPHPCENRTLEPGDRVERGQHVGWLGDSGATASGPHLHIEDRCRNPRRSLSDPYGSSEPADCGYQAGPRWNPYPSLRRAQTGTYP